METQSRFDLNNAVAAWRQELAAQTVISLEQARELETHLLDALPDLPTVGDSIHLGSSPDRLRPDELRN